MYGGLGFNPYHHQTKINGRKFFHKVKELRKREMLKKKM
jgi:hypothetical protein